MNTYSELLLQITIYAREWRCPLKLVEKLVKNLTFTVGTSFAIKLFNIALTENSKYSRITLYKISVWVYTLYAYSLRLTNIIALL